jgi:3-oxoacyl-[acyl-carrier protein] reductase
MTGNRVAIVTGGGQGIGRAVVFSLAGAGFSTVAADVNAETAARTAKEAAGFGPATHALAVDVASAGSVEAMVAETIERFGRVDALVNNAGITRDALLMRMEDESWRKVIDINLTGTYLCTKAVLRHMVKARWGRIINISSVVGAMGNAGQCNYAASKAGVIGFTKALAREVASRNVTVNAVAPGYIQTAMTDALAQEAKDKLTAIIPAQRLGAPEDVAACASFLASEGASYVTGHVLHVNGGMYM